MQHHEELGTKTIYLCHSQDITHARQKAQHNIEFLACFAVSVPDWSEQVMKDIEANGIEIFQFNPADDDDDDEVDPQVCVQPLQL